MSIAVFVPARMRLEWILPPWLKPTKRRWDEVFNYIENTPQLNDVVISGGDCYYLSPE